jgi:hypothetical protein
MPATGYAARLDFYSSPRHKAIMKQTMLVVRRQIVMDATWSLGNMAAMNQAWFPCLIVGVLLGCGLVAAQEAGPAAVLCDADGLPQLPAPVRED